MILTNPPSRSTVQDDVLRGVPLQEMLPRKGIATDNGVKDDAKLLLGCKRCFPERGLRPEVGVQSFLGVWVELQEMLPRKGIATIIIGPKSKKLIAKSCKRCFPERGLRQKENFLGGCYTLSMLQEMLPRKGIATFVGPCGNLAVARELQEMLPRKGIATPLC